MKKTMSKSIHPLETKVIVYSQITKVGEKVSKNQSMILKNISQDPTISIVELSDNVGISTKNIEVNISKLKQKGLLKRIGPARQPLKGFEMKKHILPAPAWECVPIISLQAGDSLGFIQKK